MIGKICTFRLNKYHCPFPVSFKQMTHTGQQHRSQCRCASKSAKNDDNQW